MTDPISAAGLLGLLSTIFDMIEHGVTAAERGNDIKRHAYILNIEAFLLARWAENAGILSASYEIDGVGQKKILAKSVYQEVKGVLERVLSLLEKSSVIIEKHQSPSDLVPIPRLRSRSTGQKISDQVKGVQHMARSVTWVIRDSKQFGQVVTEIAHLLELLCQLVPEEPEELKRQIFVDALPETEEADLDTLIELTIDSDEDGPVRPAVEFISRAALIRRTLPIWGVDQSQSSRGYSLPALAIPLFKEGLPQHLGRWITQVNTPQTDDWVPVLVEWRATEDQQLVFKQDVARLTKLLTLASAWPEYHILKCLGYFVDPDYRRSGPGIRYGIIFQLPQQAQKEGQDLQNLRGAILSTTSKTPSPPPSSDERLKFAQQLATAIYYLVTIGWLHKAIHSENVLLIPGKPSNSLFKARKTARDIKIGGFEFARPAAPSQRSLQPKREAFLDSYRHPECRSSEWATPDLGIVLLEIGLWQTVENVKLGFKQKRLIQIQTFEAYLIEKTKTDLEKTMGSVYAKSVELCLRANEELETTSNSGDNGELMSNFSERVLQPLVALK